MIEDDLLDNILTLAKVRGWKTMHPLKARVRKKGVETYRTQTKGDGVGWPDVFLCRGPRAEAWELKAHGAKLAPEQIAWAWALNQAGITTRQVWPEDWISGRVATWLE